MSVRPLLTGARRQRVFEAAKLLREMADANGDWFALVLLDEEERLRIAAATDVLLSLLRSGLPRHWGAHVDSGIDPVGGGG